MPKYILVRHGQTQWNKEGKYTGQSDIPLNETGREQAKAASASILNLEPDIIYSSDLQRAEDTARLIRADKKSIPLITDRRLREIHQGEWEGLHEEEIKRRFETQFETRKNDPLQTASPGGETIGDVYCRVVDFLQEMQEKHAHQLILIVAHGVVLAIFDLISCAEPIDKVFDHIPANAEPKIVTIERVE
jgi:broad specificity phosphatase PhoE